ncbi:diacylglycerol/lipid kinase family protein [Clostridium chrysemydis]|uniref:diacylglycerol/lipid kinase family protein n=1 Tax=Clostridium chrysemydis TaxID=2665504 RepID=UPI0018846A2F|nr:diacylglycerol kinase family protein [Clostridium chrysemydis]
MKHVFVINPVAGKGKALEYEERIIEIFKDRDEDFETIITKEVGHAVKALKEATKDEDCRVYSIGGDGTLNEVLNGIVGSGSSLGVVPAGSGNDFARTLYNKEYGDKLLEKLIDGKEEVIDLCKINERYYLNISSIGFDAEVVMNARKYKKHRFISGSMAYFISVIHTLFTFKPMHLTVYLDNEIKEEEMYLVAVANGKYYGGGIKIAPNADIKDGKLEVYAIKKPKIHRLIKFLPKVLKGQDVSGIDEIKYLKCEKIRVIAKKPTVVNIDGELTYLKDITFEIIKDGIKIIIPR